MLASTDCILEPAYRIRRIFYYAVEPFADNEIADILAGAFQAPPSAPSHQHREAAQTLGSISITNQNRTRVRLVAAPGLLRRRRAGPTVASQADGAAVPPGKLAQRNADHPHEHPELGHPLRPAAGALVAGFRRLPGSLARDTKAQYIALVGDGADRVTTLLVQPSGSEESPLVSRRR